MSDSDPTDRAGPAAAADLFSNQDDGAVDEADQTLTEHDELDSEEEAGAEHGDDDDDDDRDYDRDRSRSPSRSRARARTRAGPARQDEPDYPQDYDDDDDDENNNNAHDDNEPPSQPQTKDKVVMTVKVYRHRLPKPKDQTLRSLRVPPFLKFIPEEYVSDSFRPSQFDIENSTGPNPKNVIRYRIDPATLEAQSNTNIYRWSDGSVSLSVGSDHYELQTKSLAPPPNKPYQELQDAHYYAAAAELRSNLFVVVGHVSEQYTVRPTKEADDDALSRLAERMAAAAASRETDMVIRSTDDPELDRKRGEAAAKERARAQRRRENAEMRANTGTGVAGRSGRAAAAAADPAFAKGQALPPAGVEPEAGTGPKSAGRKRGAPASSASRPKRRRPEYDSDDDPPQGAGRHDEYDREDDFIAPSDEEEYEDEDGAANDEPDEDDEDADLDIDIDEFPQAHRKPASRPSRQRATTKAQDSDARGEAVGDDDDDEGTAVGPSRGGARRRRVVDDDEE